MTHFRILGILGLVVLVLAACGETAPSVGEVKGFTAVCDKINDGKRTAVDGYLSFPDSFTDSQSVVLRLYETDAFKGAPIGVQMTIGTQANPVEKVPDHFSDNDLHIHLANGQVAGYGTKIRVSGNVYFPIVAQDFACALENPLVEQPLK